MELADLTLPGGLAGRHVLAVPTGTDVVALATAWFPGARWAREPVSGAQTTTGRSSTGSLFRAMTGSIPVVTPEPGIIGLDATSALEGPTVLDAEAARSVGLGAVDHDLYALLSTAGGAGLDQVQGWMTAAARRTGGAVLPADRSRVIAPDPAAMVDLTLWSSVSMSPDDLAPLVRPALAGTRVGPTDDPTPTPGGPAVALTATFEYDGSILLRTGKAAEVPVVLSTMDWREFGPWGYHVVWAPPVPAELEVESPSPLHVIARSRVSPTMARLTVALWRAVGGTVVDSGGFVVPIDEVRERAEAIVR